MGDSRRDGLIRRGMGDSRRYGLIRRGITVPGTFLVIYIKNPDV